MIKRTLVVSGTSAALVLAEAAFAQIVAGTSVVSVLTGAAFAQTSRTESSLNRTRYLPEHEDPSGTFARLRLERVVNPARANDATKQGSGATVLDFAGRAAPSRQAVLCDPCDPDNDPGPSAA